MEGRQQCALRECAPAGHDARGARGQLLAGGGQRDGLDGGPEGEGLLELQHGHVMVHLVKGEAGVVPDVLDAGGLAHPVEQEGPGGSSAHADHPRARAGHAVGCAHGVVLADDGGAAHVHEELLHGELVGHVLDVGLGAVHDVGRDATPAAEGLAGNPAGRQRVCGGKAAGQEDEGGGVRTHGCVRSELLGRD